MMRRTIGASAVWWMRAPFGGAQRGHRPSKEVIEAVLRSLPDPAPQRATNNGARKPSAKRAQPPTAPRAARLARDAITTEPRGATATTAEIQPLRAEQGRGERRASRPVPHAVAGAASGSSRWAGNSPGLERIYTTATYEAWITEMKTRHTLMGVPLQPRAEAREQLKFHVQDSPDQAGARVSLLCNTGPKGSGKSALMLQNLVDARDLGCVSFGVEWNGQQPLTDDDCRAIRDTGDIEIVVGVRVLANACGFKWLAQTTHETVFDHVVRYAAEHGKGPVTLEQLRAIRTLAGHVDVAKKLTGTEDRPAFVAVDEFAKLRGASKRSKRSLEKLLSTLCHAMDSSIQGTTTLLDPQRVYLAVSVYDAADLATLTTGSSRPLLVQPLPPIFPVLMTSHAGVARLPGLLRVLCDEAERGKLPYGAQGSAFKKLSPGLLQMALLLRDSWGHPRRAEMLVEAVTKHERASGAQDVAALLADSEGIGRLKAAATDAMDEVLGIGEVCNPTDLSPATIRILLEGLFRMDNVYRGRGVAHACLRKATREHYQLVPAMGGRDIGYLPMEAVGKLLRRRNGRPWWERSIDEIKDLHDTLVLKGEPGGGRAKDFEKLMYHALALRDEPWWESSVKRIHRLHRDMVETTAASGTPKHFETLMHHTLPLCFGFNIDGMASLFDELGADAKAALRNVTEVDGIDFDDPRCTQFPWVGKSPADSDRVLEAIAKVGGSADSSQRGLAIMPTEELNRGYDHYLVLPKDGGGRVVLAFQEKDWFGDNFNSRTHHVVREARWGRQYFTQDQVYWGREAAKTHGSPNAFRKQLQARMASARGTTDVIFVLVTPNRVGAGAGVDCRVPRSTEAAEVMTAAGVLPDEGRLSLEGMKVWCPTVAYAALASLALRSTLASPREGPGESP